MAGTECVVFAFAALGKTRDAVQHAQGFHCFAPSGQYLVAIGLVADVPHQSVVRCIEHVMQRNRQLDRAQVG